MDFRRLERVLKQSDHTANGSEPFDFTALTPNLLDAIIPGYSLASRLASSFIGIDVSILLTYSLFLFAITSGAKYLWRHFYRILMNNWMCYVMIEGRDELYGLVLRWSSEQKMARNSRRLLAVTNHASQPDETGLQEYISADGLFNFGKWAAKRPPAYEPAAGLHWFWFQHRPFLFERVIKSTQDRGGSKFEEHSITVRCVGRSTKPLKAWLEHVKMWSAEQQMTLTTIKRPGNFTYRHSTGWSAVTSRPSRPMSTVILANAEKQRLIADVNEYMHPASTRWYAMRGIPYRRGYLFHGPPGTGKSSLSFALAGLFGLAIHVVSLNEQGPGGISENELVTLFNTLPKRCIVLLEDIDAAGMRRPDSDETDPTHGKKSSSNESEAQTDDIRALAREIGRIGQSNRAAGGSNNGSISLSGLLNAIDGVASHEGRVLIMTTNHPEKLDSALIRPGRVDMQVKFCLSSKSQAREIYFRMYEEGDSPPPSDMQSDLPKIKPQPVSRSSRRLDLDELDAITPPSTPGAEQSAKSLAHSFLILEPEPPLTPQELSDLSDRFADRIPDGVFSPAEIQSYLIVRKKRPRQAVDDVEVWRDELMKVKRGDVRATPIL